MPKSIYTSGLTGFIGRNLRPYLLKKYDQIVNFERDNKATIYGQSSNKSVVISDELIKQFNAKHLIHLATLYRPNSKSTNELTEVIQSNIKFILDIIEDYLPKEEIEVINVSSYMQLLDIKYQNSYSLSKEIVNMFLKDNGYLHKNIYLFDSFGTGDTRNKVTDVFIKKIISGSKIQIPSSDIFINLSHVDDICHSIMQSIEMPNGNYSIMSENTIQLTELLNIIIGNIGKSVEIERLGDAINYLDKVENTPKNIYIQANLGTLKERLNDRINEIKQA